MLRQEIGGDFSSYERRENKEKIRNVFQYLNGFSTKYFDSGRSALKAFLANKQYRKVLLPGYICESVRDCFSKECDIEYYRVDCNIKIDWQDLLKKCESGVDLVYLHFFNGYIDSEYDFDALLKLKQKFGFVILEDTTHSFFTSPCLVGDYCVCSLRKWFPIADGGVLYSKNDIIVSDLPECEWADKKRAAMLEKKNYLQGVSGDKQSFLAVFSATERALDEQISIYQASQASLETLKCIDCDTLMECRKRNFSFLQKGINNKAVACNGINQVPLFFTMIQEDRDELRRFFIEHDIYCPIHWPLYDELENLEDAVRIYKTELSIPIDQRYDEKDMEYICQKYCEYVEWRKKRDRINSVQ